MSGWKWAPSWSMEQQGGPDPPFLSAAQSLVTDKAWKSYLCHVLCGAVLELYWRKRTTFLFSPLCRSVQILQCSFPYHQHPVWHSVWKANHRRIQIPEPRDWKHGKLRCFSVTAWPMVKSPSFVRLEMRLRGDCASCLCGWIVLGYSQGKEQEDEERNKIKHWKSWVCSLTLPLTCV